MTMKFSIGFDKRDTALLHKHWDQIIETNKWTEGYFTQAFEEKWSEQNNGMHSVSFMNWYGAAEAMLAYYDVKGQTVLVPSNTFMATPAAVLRAGGKVEFVDCNREDLCMSYDDFKTKAEKYKPKGVFLVHIGGHIAFDTQKIADYCRDRDILLFEDCAHAHGASWNGKKPGEWGVGGLYSFYATKTISTGEGGMLVTRDAGFADFARRFRNYGKPNYEVVGGNFRINEFAAAIGVVQTARLPEIIAFKNDYAKKLDREFSNRVRFPEGMVSGYYKYIVFDQIPNSTGKVYEEPCHRIMKREVTLPNTDWVAKNHWCVPIYYQPELK